MRSTAETPSTSCSPGSDPRPLSHQAAADAELQLEPVIPTPRYWDLPRTLHAVAFGLVVASIVLIGFLPISTEASINADGAVVSVTRNGFENILNLSPSFTITMVLALLLTLTPLLIKGTARTTVSVAVAIAMVVLTVVGVLLVNNWLLAPPTALVGFAALFAATVRNHSWRGQSASPLSA